MRIFTIIILLLLCKTSFCQPKVSKLSKHSLPTAIQYVGHIVNAVRWTDSLGENIVVTTETGETRSKGTDDGNRDAALYAYHYIAKGDSLQLTWKVYDYIKECPVDLTAGFIKNAFAITDLNLDNKAEVWLLFKTVCRGDVSPAEMKIIMYEDNKKYAVRGRNKVQLSPKEYDGGEYTFDDAFKKAPQAFKQFAAELWKKNMMEKWD